ncbi:MAG: HEAT repeat domain-containing protein [Planctomycetota bacterium]
MRTVVWVLALASMVPGQLVLEGGRGPLAGKHVVFLTGDEEYRSEEAMPMLARIVAKRHGAKCSVLFALGEDGAIDPEARGSLGMPEAIDTADLLVMQLRFRAWDDATMQRFVAAYRRGVPIVALRTSTHAFAYPADSESEFKRFSWNSKEWPGGFGRQVLGETWVSHHGNHKVEATRGVIEPANATHPILRGVDDVFGDSDVYTANPPDDCSVLLRGQVLQGLGHDDAPVAGKKNDPMQPIAWTRTHTNDAGTQNFVFCTTMGAATDLRSADLRRLLVNAIYHGLGLDVPAAADVDIVGTYAPTAYGFGVFQRGVHPSEWAMPDDGSQPLQLRKGERVALVGGGLAERVASLGHFEALLHTRFPQLELQVRGFGWPGDEVGVQQRPDDYTRLDDPLVVFAPDTLLCFFGGNEAFAGESGLAGFVTEYERWLDRQTDRLRHEGRTPRFVLISPIATEDTGDPHLPPAAPRNRALAQYSAAIAALAERRGLRFVDVLAPTATRFAAAPGAQCTLDGLQLAETGSTHLALALDRALFGGDNPAVRDGAQFARLLAAVADKAWVHANDYRMLNGWYVYGGRRTFDTKTFPTEYQKVRAMVAARDRHVWALARGEEIAGPDDSATGELFTPETTFGSASYSEPKELRFVSAAESAAAMKVVAGLAVQPFASEADFPELANPVQLNFDDRGRLWVACMPTYPLWRPGDPKPSDRLLIFEDEDRDGRADRVKVFYDQLHCPTGFEFWNGGVLVTCQPRMLFLQDTDGDDRADVVRQMFDGFASDDTHHAIGAYEWSPGGLLHMLEGVHMAGAIETPWGVRRNKGPAGSWVLDPRRRDLRYFQTPGYGNPWCYVFDGRGRGIVGDGTSGQQHFDPLLSGAQFSGRSAPSTVFDNKGMRPVIGSEFLISRHLPDEVQGQMIYACVINMHGLTRFTVREDGAGLTGERIEDLLASDDAMFRPADPQIGPDGALWFGDWCNPLIGHMQYSQRDPNRDKKHGRIFRLVAKDRAPLTPVTQHGKSIPEVFEQLREPEPRTRYRARRWLRARPTDEVLPALRRWVDGIADDPAHDLLAIEALWVQQGHDRVDPALLRACLGAKDPETRAAAVHVVGDMHDRTPDAFTLLAAAARDPHPRVRLEALRGLSFLPTKESVLAALSVTEQAMDKWLEYELDVTLSALAPVWQPRFVAGEALAKPGSTAAEILASHRVVKRSEAAAQKAVARANDRAAPPADRRAAMLELGNLPGNATHGREVFGRICIACHRAGGQGVQVGPDLDGVSKRLTLALMVESIFEPNARIEPKYQMVMLALHNGDALAGFIDAEAPDHLVVRLADGSRRTIALADIKSREALATSNMPEGLGQTLSPRELVDVIAYLKTL